MNQSTPTRRTLMSLLTRWIARAAITYVFLLGLLMFFENWLVYPGSKFPAGNWTPKNFSFEEIEFEAGDGTRLVGWFLPRSERLAAETKSAELGPRISETVLLCHGNAENVAQSSGHTGELTRLALNADVFVFDYRGYGKSAGSPYEAGVLDDAESALNWLCERTGKQPGEVTLLGRSIGGGPACHLAGKFGCRALVLQRTFNSLVDAAQANYPVFPVKYLMSNRFLSEKKIKNYSGPLFQSHGQDDSMIPIGLARKLFEAAPTKQKQFYEIPNMGHNDPLPEAYWFALRSFFESL